MLLLINARILAFLKSVSTKMHCHKVKHLFLIVPYVSSAFSSYVGGS